jgi:hypothetical protein
MPTIDEKRVYSETRTAESVAVASDLGLVVASVSGDFVGEFGVAHRGACRDVASADGTLVVATDADVVLLPPDADDATPADFGPARAVSLAGGDVVALGEDGTVARRPLRGAVAGTDDTDATTGTDDGDAAGDGTADGWTTVGTVDEGRALDGDLLAASDGVYRVGDALAPAGLDDVRDVAVADVPRAATGTGLYRLGNGWMDEYDDPCRLVAAAPDGRAHAVAVDAGDATDGSDYDGDAAPSAADADAERLLARDGDGWSAVESPVEGPVAGVAYGETATYLVGRDGTLAAAEGDGWRTQALGVRGVGGLTVR